MSLPVYRGYFLGAVYGVVQSDLRMGVKLRELRGEKSDGGF